MPDTLLKPIGPISDTFPVDGLALKSVLGPLPNPDTQKSSTEIKRANCALDTLYDIIRIKTAEIVILNIFIPPPPLALDIVIHCNTKSIVFSTIFLLLPFCQVHFKLEL